MHGMGWDGLGWDRMSTASRAAATLEGRIRAHGPQPPAAPSAKALGRSNHFEPLGPNPSQVAASLEGRTRLQGFQAAAFLSSCWVSTDTPAGRGFSRMPHLAFPPKFPMSGPVATQARQQPDGGPSAAKRRRHGAHAFLVAAPRV